MEVVGRGRGYKIIDFTRRAAVRTPRQRRPAGARPARKA
jgi:hypothetical protein